MVGKRGVPVVSQFNETLTTKGTKVHEENLET
jgi:hypothetical protein